MATEIENIIYEDEWLDNLINVCRPLWIDLQQTTFKRYREIGQHIIKSGYQKGQWHSKEKAKFIEGMKISDRTFNHMINLGEMTDAEFRNVIAKFGSLYEWANQSKSIEESYLKEVRIIFNQFSNEKEAKAYFENMNGILKGCYWIGIIDKRLLEE